MENQLIELIEQYKKGEVNAFIEIQNKMNPLIIKYARILHFNDFEDMVSELVLTLLECINDIKFYSSEYEVLHYIKRAIINRFHELYRSSMKSLDEILLSANFDDNESLLTNYSNEFSNIIFKTDMLAFISKIKKNKKNIAYSILIEGLSDIEIGKKYNVTRQYVHRLRVQFYTKISSELLNQ